MSKMRKRKGAPSSTSSSTPAPALTPTSTPKYSLGDVFSELIVKDDETLLKAYTGNVHTLDKHGFNALMIAAMHRCPVSLRWAIRHGVGRSSIDKAERVENMTPLMFACLAATSLQPSVLDNPECARMLVLAGADPKLQNSKGDTALHWAVSGGMINIVRFFATLEPLFPGLLSMRNFPTSGDGRSQTALELAQSKCYDDIAAVLLAALDVAAGAADTPAAHHHHHHGLVIDPSTYGCDVKSLELKIKLKKRVPVAGGPTEETIVATVGEYLCSCARRGDVETLARYITHIDNVDSDGRTVLMAACVARRVDVVCWYLQLMPQRLYQLSQVDDYNCTVVHFAAAGGKSADQQSPECLRLVVEAGANMNARDNTGCTALHLAAQLNHAEIVEYLLSRSECDVGAQDVFGRTPAYYARSNYHHALADLLDAEAARRGKHFAPSKSLHDRIADDDLESIAAYVGDMLVRDKKGHTALMVAAMRRRVKAMTWLIDNVCNDFAAVNKLDDRKTALMYACCSGDGGDNEACVSLLMPHVSTAILNMASSTGDTALHYAAAAGYAKAVNRLLQRRDLCLTARNHLGWTAAEVAARAGRADLEKKIIAADTTSFMKRCATSVGLFHSTLALDADVQHAFLTLMASFPGTVLFAHVLEAVNTATAVTAVTHPLAGMTPDQLKKLIAYMFRMNLLQHEVPADDEFNFECDQFSVAAHVRAALAEGRPIGGGGAGSASTGMSFLSDTDVVAVVMMPIVEYCGAGPLDMEPALRKCTSRMEQLKAVGTLATNMFAKVLAEEKQSVMCARELCKRLQDTNVKLEDEVNSGRVLVAQLKQSLAELTVQRDTEAVNARVLLANAKDILTAKYANQEQQVKALREEVQALTASKAALQAGFEKLEEEKARLGAVYQRELLAEKQRNSDQIDYSVKETIREQQAMFKQRLKVHEERITQQCVEQLNIMRAKHEQQRNDDQLELARLRAELVECWGRDK